MRFVGSTKDVDNALDRAAAFLAASQLPHGEFRTLLGSDAQLSNATYDNSPFVTTFVVYAMNQAGHPRFPSLLQKATQFLASEMEFGGVWRYFGSRQYKHCRIPPDIDDTACASYALRSNGKRAPRNRWIFRASCNSTGRFYTWIVPRSGAPKISLFKVTLALGRLQAERARRAAPRPSVATDARLLITDRDPVRVDDIDPVVNANAILYLGQSPDTLPAIDWLNEFLKCEMRDSVSSYYPDALALHYMVARACRHSAPGLSKSGATLVSEALKRQASDGSFGSILATALALSVLLTFVPQSVAIPAAIGRILQSQEADGSWAMHPFFYASPTEFWGSPELTSAFCIEVLARYRRTLVAGAGHS